MGVRLVGREVAPIASRTHRLDRNAVHPIVAHIAVARTDDHTEGGGFAAPTRVDAADETGQLFGRVVHITYPELDLECCPSAGSTKWRLLPRRNTDFERRCGAHAGWLSTIIRRSSASR